MFAIYPNGKVAGQIIGYTGKTGRNLDGIIDNHETLWPETEGREGLEQTFNELLTGKHGEYKLTFDKDGRKTSEKLINPAVPGNNIVTTLDLRLQELAEKALAAKAKRGAIVIVDPTDGDILAMASWPTYDPNRFRPVDFGGEIQAIAGRSRHSAIAARVSLVLSAGFDVQGRGRHCRAGEPARSIRTICINAFRRSRLAISPFTIGKKAIGCAEFRPGAHRIVRHLVLSGRNQDRRGADHRLGAETWIWREVRHSVARRSGRARAERRIHESDARPQNCSMATSRTCRSDRATRRSRRCKWRRRWRSLPTAAHFIKRVWCDRCSR